MTKETVTDTTALGSGLLLALLGTTCCALPILLVILGMGSVAASIITVLPWLAWLSQYKVITFGITVLLLTYSGWRLRHTAGSVCTLEGAKRLKWQRRVLGINTFFFVMAVFAAYALLPIILWLEG